MSRLPVRRPPWGWVREKGNRGLQPVHDVLRALWRALLDIGENRLKLLGGAARVADLHRPYFAHMARTSSSVANSPRSASASEASRSASSSAVDGIGVCSMPANCSFRLGTGTPVVAQSTCSMASSGYGPMWGSAASLGSPSGVYQAGYYGTNWGQPIVPVQVPVRLGIRFAVKMPC